MGTQWVSQGNNFLKRRVGISKNETPTRVRMHPRSYFFKKFIWG
jgi:hypothetical protein